MSDSKKEKVQGHEPDLADELKNNSEFKHLLKDVPPEHMKDVLEEVDFVTEKWQSAYAELLKAFGDPEAANKFRSLAKDRWKMDT